MTKKKPFEQSENIQKQRFQNVSKTLKAYFVSLAFHEFTLTYNNYNKVSAYSACCPRGGLRALNFGPNSEYPPPQVRTGIVVSVEKGWR